MVVAAGENFRALDKMLSSTCSTQERSAWGITSSVGMVQLNFFFAALHGKYSPGPTIFLVRSGETKYAASNSIIP